MAGWARSALVSALALLVVLGSADRAAAVDQFTFGKPNFCTPKEPLRDFGISRLPPLRELPLEGELPFAPPSVSAYGGFSRILTQPEGFGYGFFEENYEGTVRLDWTVTAQMWFLSRRGESLREVGSTTLRIGRLDAANQPHIDLEPLARRGFYRFDIQFADRDGTQLGAYGAYLKVVRPFWKARLGLDRRAYRPGQLVVSRPENLGTEWMSFGEAFGVQRWEGGEWVQAPELTPDAWLAWLGYAGPGTSGRCSVLSLPRDISPGHYRIVKAVARGFSPRRARTYHLTAPFVVR